MKWEPKQWCISNCIHRFFL